MKVEFKSQTPEVKIEEGVCLGGKMIGWVRTHNEDGCMRFHAGLNTTDSDLLIQGFGATREAAILDAIVRGRRSTQRKIEFIDELERELFA